ncbi:cytochrome c556 [Rhodobacter aestuarii]|uniref:Cytochrome c556 n=1 Tax=Rhodobacter aestuarii TaxID=453582 RepID=A0A1N7MQD6_9RHOB|nr:cytochrome c [Rhodobacter aestuarii]PTV96612.1 cytochrome c556 [Rhodobacter aestuarii]SIS88238.1 Cytochrome c556 [Rhodobacter aestuarii]
MHARLIPMMALSLALGTAAIAGEEAKDPDVKARIALMQDLKAHSKLLSETASGKIAYDAEKIEAVIEALRRDADQVGPAFKAPADDPVSEALPIIWQERSEFRLKVNRLLKAANELKGGSAKDIADTLNPVQAACKDCHGRFKM